MTWLVVDEGTSGVRSALVDDNLELHDVEYRTALPDSPAPGLVEFDAQALAETTLAVARRAATQLAEAGTSAAGVGMSNQRASVVVWERTTGKPVAPGIGWQDLRTVGTSLVLAAEGIRFAPNLSGTKFAHILDTVDPDRRRARNGEICCGTVDSWLIYTLTGGTRFATEPSNAALTGLLNHSATDWDPALLERLGIPEQCLPEILDSTASFGPAVAVPGNPQITGVAGDQQCSLIGQGATQPGTAKLTFGTGGMLDVCVGPKRPAGANRTSHGSFPIVCWRHQNHMVWGLEAAMLTAGTAVEWLRDDLGLIDTAADSDSIAASVADSGDVWFVPAFLGLGTPYWDYGARGALVGLTRGTERAHVVRAVLEGVAHRGADLVEAAALDLDTDFSSIRIDGGMSANDTFVQAFADASGCRVEVSHFREATTFGAGLLAAVGSGRFSDPAELTTLWRPAKVVEPHVRAGWRERWAEAVERSRRWHTDLSAIDF